MATAIVVTGDLNHELTLQDKRTAVMATVSRMTRDLKQERASLLAKEAVELSDIGHVEQASRKLREAAALGHDNLEVQTAFLKLHKGEVDSPLLGLCRRYAFYHDEKAGDDAARYLQADGQHFPGSVAVESLKLVLESNYATLSASQDVIIAELARQSREVRSYFVYEMQVSTTEFFDRVYERGDRAANCLRTIVLEPTLWPSEEIRLRTQDDLFQLLLAKLMESGTDLDGRALKGIALLLVADTKRLQAFIDDEGFDAILSSLDIRLSADVRSQASIAVAKYLEVAEEQGRTYFTAFVRSRLAKQKNSDFITIFSAAASLFSIVPTTTSPLFLTEGFLPSMMPLISRKLNNDKVIDAFLALLNAACVDGNCRCAISEHCSSWLSHVASNGVESQPARAATVLAKLRTADTVKESDDKVSDEGQDIQELVHIFKTALALNARTGRTAPDSIEGLAYASLKPEVKEELSKDTKFLKSFFQTLTTGGPQPEIVVGGLSVLSNLTRYSANLTEEQKKMSQLRAYTNASRPSPPSALEDEQHVTARCRALVEAGIVPALVYSGKNTSLSGRRLIDSILVSLSKSPKNRGIIAQQGAVKLLISHLQTMSKAATEESTASFEAAHALARVLISVNPSHVFPASGLPHITSAVGPLVTLLKPDAGGTLADQPRDLLPIFEGLLALTNLASSPDETAANTIIRLAWGAVEDLLLSSNVMIRRASCELVCNLAPSEAGAAKFADGSRRAGQRLHVLLALADVEDLATRRAAGGALAMLTGYDAAIGAVLDIKRGVEILQGLCQDDEEDVAHRGAVCVQNLSCASGDAGIRARRALKDAGAVGMLTTRLRNSNNTAVLQAGAQALKALVEKT